jgi:hypothetical protein
MFFISQLPLFRHEGGTKGSVFVLSGAGITLWSNYQ